MAMRRASCLLILACLAWSLLPGCAAWREAPGSGDVLTRYEVPGPPPDPPTHVASRAMLPRSAAVLFRKGRYKRAEQHLEPVLAERPGHYLATAYMGLCRWFQGRPDETAALWRGYENPDLPGLGPALSREAEGLLLLAERLRARRAVFEAGQGLLPAVAPGPAAVFDFDASALPPEDQPLGAALAALTGANLDQVAPDLSGVPRDRIRAWLDETGADPASLAADAQRALGRARGLARLLGAEFAVTGRLRPDPAAPGAMVLDLLVLPAEDPPERRTRIQGGLTRAVERLEAVVARRAELAADLERLARGLDHFRDLERLNGMLREREAAKERVRSLMQAGDLESGRAALAELDALQERIESLHERCRAFRMAAYAAELGRFSVDKALLEDFRDQARAEDRDLAAEADRLETRRADLDRQLSRELPVHGVPARVDLPPLMTRSWPDLAARAVARILDRDAATTGPAMVMDQADAARLAALGRALIARDQGRRDDSAREPGLADGLAAASMQPPDDFDLQALADLEETAMVEALETRILAIMHREAGAFLAAGGSATEFDRLAEGR